MSITVKASVSKSEMPYSANSFSNSCQTSITIRVPVPTGESRYILIDYNNDIANNASYTITEETDITLTLTGAISNDESLNTVFSRANIQVKLTSSSPSYYTKQIVRTHSENEC